MNKKISFAINYFNPEENTYEKPDTSILITGLMGYDSITYLYQYYCKTSHIDDVIIKEGPFRYIFKINPVSLKKAIKELKKLYNIINNSILEISPNNIKKNRILSCSNEELIHSMIEEKNRIKELYESLEEFIDKDLREWFNAQDPKGLAKEIEVKEDNTNIEKVLYSKYQNDKCLLLEFY